MSIFINIHSHRKQEKDEIIIHNFFPDDISNRISNHSGFFSCGIHPWYLKPGEDWLNDQMQKLKQSMDYRGCLAIGETGLDKAIGSDWGLQLKVFEKQIRLAEEFGKPMIIHSVRAWSDLLALRKSSSAKATWIFHGFNSSIQMANQLIDSGCMLSFGKSLLQPGKKIREIMAEISSENFFLETDDADVNIEDIYKAVSNIKNLPLEKMIKAQHENFEKIFGFTAAEAL